jgi:hypothetical protein
MGQVLVDGKWVDSESKAAKEFRRRSARPSSCQTYTESKPFVSQALAVHSSQVAAMNEEVKAAGLSSSIAYLPDGSLRVTSRQALAEECKRRGVLNADAGYGDHAGN